MQFSMCHQLGQFRSPPVPHTLKLRVNINGGLGSQKLRSGQEFQKFWGTRETPCVAVFGMYRPKYNESWGENSRARLAAKKMENCNTPVIGPSHARSGEATRLAAPGKRAAPHGTVCDATEPTRSGVFFPRNAGKYGGGRRTRRRGPEYFSRNNGKYGGQTRSGVFFPK